MVSELGQLSSSQESTGPDRKAFSSAWAEISVMHLLSSFHVGGAEMVALELARSMDPDRFRVLACSLDGCGPMADRFEAAGVRPLSLDRSRLRQGYDIGLAWRLANLLRDSGTDILHCHNTFAKLYGTVGGALARVPVVVCSQHAVPSEQGIRESHFLAKVANPLATRFVAVAEYVRRTGVQAGYVLPDRTTVIYNGIDLSRFQPRDGHADASQTMVVGCVGRLSEEKRHELLFEAIAGLKREDVDVRLQVVGDGPRRQHLEAAAARLDIEEEVEFLGMRDDVPALLRRMDVFALTSSTEGLPLSVIEAMACALPVVATRVGGLPELVEDSVSGLLVPVEDAAAIANALCRLAQEPGLRARMGKAGRLSAVERFSLAACAAQHENLYVELLQENGVHPRGGAPCT